MDLQSIVSELKSERDRIARAIAALENESMGGRGKSAGRSSASTTKPRRGHGLTPAGRRRLSESMKRRWAARRGAGIVSAKTTASAAPKKKRGGLTAAGRKRLSEMMKKRWAEKKKRTRRLPFSRGLKHVLPGRAFAGGCLLARQTNTRCKLGSGRHEYSDRDADLRSDHSRVTLGRDLRRYLVYVQPPPR